MRGTRAWRKRVDSLQVFVMVRKADVASGTTQVPHPAAFEGSEAHVKVFHGAIES